MTLNLFLDSGVNTQAETEKPISDLNFGARYISYNNEARFLEQISEADIGLIVWPGGTLAETREDRYGFEFDDLYAPATGKPGLSDMMEIAVDKGVGLSVVLPTYRYAGETEALKDDLDTFMDKLLSGGFGQLPDPMILEIGNEYYAHFSGPSAASDYAEIADVMITEIALALGDPSQNTLGVDVTIAVQAGKTEADDLAIREGLSDFAMSSIDMITHHRFAFQPQGIDPRIETLADSVSAWEEDVAAVGGDVPNLFVSAWNTVTQTRDGTLRLFVESQHDQGTAVDPDSVDLEGRTHTAFENFWQSQLDAAAYGQEHAAYLLESFASYAEAGMDAGAVYGFDSPHPGSLSWREAGFDHSFVGAEMIEMIYESVGGTHVLPSDNAYDPDDPISTYGFENEDKLVVFLAAGETAPGEVLLDLGVAADDLLTVRAERLSSETPADWMAVFGIADNPDVDEGPEAATYAVGIRDPLAPEVSPDGIRLDLTEPHEIVRLAFAKTAAGEAEIASWSDAPAIELGSVLPIQSGPQAQTVADTGPDFDDPDDSGGDAAGMGGGIGALFALLFFLL